MTHEGPLGEPILELGGLRYHRSPMRRYARKLLVRTLAFILLTAVLVWLLGLPWSYLPVMAGVAALIAIVLLVLRARARAEVDASVVCFPNGLLLRGARWEERDGPPDRLPLRAHRWTYWLRRPGERFLPTRSIRSIDLLVLRDILSEGSENIVIRSKKGKDLYVYGVSGTGFKLAARALKLPFNRDPILRG